MRVDTVPIRHLTELVKDKEALLGGLEINISLPQMLKGKEQAVREQKTEKDDGPCKAEEADNIRKKPVSISFQTDKTVRNPVGTTVQLQTALSQMLETVVNHTPDSELTNREQPEPPLEPDGTFAAAAAADVRPERMTAAKAGDRWVPDYAELEVENSLHTMRSHVFSPNKEAEASERDSELSRAGFARTDREVQPIILCEEHPGHQEAADQQKPSPRGKTLLDIQDRDGKVLKIPVHVEYIHPVNNRDMSGPAATRYIPETVTVRTASKILPVDVGKTIATKLPGDNGMLTIELKPAILGKMTIKTVYEAGRAVVSIMSANPKILGLLSQNINEIANILEEKTGQQTVVYTPGMCQESEGYRDHQERGSQRQDSEKEKRWSRPDSFTQQLRLGLV